MGAAVTEAVARKATSTMIDRISLPYVVIKIAHTYCPRFRCSSYLSDLADTPLYFLSKSLRPMRIEAQGAEVGGGFS